MLFMNGCTLLVREIPFRKGSCKTLSCFGIVEKVIAL